MDAILFTGADASDRSQAQAQTPARPRTRFWAPWRAGVGRRHRRVVAALAGAGGVFLSALLPHLVPVPGVLLLGMVQR
jgi:hypothetical protein